MSWDGGLSGCAGAGAYGTRSRSSSTAPEPIFWTPGLAEQMTPLNNTANMGRGGASAARDLDGLVSTSAAESQHRALSSLLGSLQAASQKGSNRC